MKTRHFLIFLVLFVFVNMNIFSMAKKDSVDSTKLVIYAYDSFTAEWGMGPEVVKQFEKQTGYKVEMVTCADGQEVLNKAIFEKEKPYADLLIGIDNLLADTAKKAGVLASYKPKNAVDIPDELHPSGQWLLTPFDWGYFAIMFDTESSIPVPKSLEDLTKPEYKKSLVIMDPRTSTPGLGFLAWTHAAYGKDYLSYWKRLKPSLLTISSNWSTGYGLFTQGEAPLVLSYTTSMAYHIRYDNTERYQALIFSDGHIRQTEYMGLVKNATNPKAAKEFIEFMLENFAQEILPETQWMYPASEKAVLPKSFMEVPLPQETLSISSKTVTDSLQPLFNELAY